LSENVLLMCIIPPRLARNDQIYDMGHNILLEIHTGNV
jgi:hypothetical protein